MAEFGVVSLTIIIDNGKERLTREYFSVEELNFEDQIEYPEPRMGESLIERLNRGPRVVETALTFKPQARQDGVTFVDKFE